MDTVFELISDSVKASFPSTAEFRDKQADEHCRRIATCSTAHDLKVYAFTTACSGNLFLLDDLKGHIGPIWEVSWSPANFGNLLASCGFDGKVIIWKEKNWKFIKQYEYTDHFASVNSVRFSPEKYGLVFACGSADSCISFVTHNTETLNWDAQKIQNAHRFGCMSVSWAPALTPMTSDSTKFVKRLASGGCDNLVKIWTEKDGRWVAENKLEGHSGWVTSVAWAPSKGLMYRDTIASCSKDKTVIIWTSDDGSNWNSTVLHTFDLAPTTVSFSPFENILTISEECKSTLWKQDCNGMWKISAIFEG